MPMGFGEPPRKTSCLVASGVLRQRQRAYSRLCKRRVEQWRRKRRYAGAPRLGTPGGPRFRKNFVNVVWNF